MILYCGREFSEIEIRRIRRLITENPDFHRAELSRQVCHILQWFKPDGKLKDMSCRVAMLRMHEDKLIKLPPPRFKKPALSKINFTPATNQQDLIVAPVHKLDHLSIIKIQRDSSALWNEYIERYHYIGYKPLPGAQLRYFIFSGQQVVALLGFGAAAWQTAPRDKFIGWTHPQRKKNLHLIVNNARFLILPWIQSKNLASKILSMAARKVPEDWFEHYKIKPVLLESFVESGRFEGTCYKAANWIKVGQTKGRGKLGPAGSVPIKDIWLYPVEKKFKQELTK